MVTSTLAAVIWPANFVSASRPHRSSISPIAMIRPPATTTAGIPVEYTKPRVRAGSQEDRGDHTDVHRQPAHPRGGLHVHISLARVGDRAEAGGQDSHRTGGEI